MATHCRNYIYTFLFFTSIALPPRPAYDRSAQSHWGRIIHEALLASILAATLSSVPLSANITFPNNPLPEVTIVSGLRTTSIQAFASLRAVTSISLHIWIASRQTRATIRTILARSLPIRFALYRLLWQAFIRQDRHFLMPFFLGQRWAADQTKSAAYLRTAPLASSRFRLSPSCVGHSSIAQSVERRTVNPQVPGSNSGRGAKSRAPLPISGGCS